jgi:predicted cupin superfamily sugar epimerase
VVFVNDHLPEWARGLALQPHPEGGYYAETWSSGIGVPGEALPGDFDGERVLATAILFLLPPGAVSAWHVVKSDELWFFHRGGPLELSLGGDSGDSPLAEETIVLGPDLLAGHQVQAIVPGGVWQTARPLTDEAALVGCVVSPGFDFRDFRLVEDPTEFADPGPRTDV